MEYSGRQTSWGWLVALYVFLAGVGGGTFLFSFILNAIGIYQPEARVGALVGVLLVLAGTLVLLFDLGSIRRAYRLFTTPSTLLASWMARGAWILTAFVIMGLAYALPAFAWFQWLPWSPLAGAALVIGILAALLAILVVVYPGFLFGVLESVPFWNTPALPLLFFLSGLDTGIALLALIALLSPPGLEVAGLHLLALGDVVLIVLLFIILGAYLEIARQARVTASASVYLLKNSLFVGGVIVLGMLLPLVMLIYSLFLSTDVAVYVLTGVAGVLVLAGGLFLRYSIIRAGVRVAVR